MIGWTFQNIPNHIDVHCRECGGRAVMKDPFFVERGKAASDILADPNARGLRVGGAVVVERFPDALRWSEARAKRFSFADGALGVVSCAKCVSRYAHTLSWSADAFYRVEYRGESLWAWNREYLVIVRDFIASPARDTYASYYLRRKIPKFFLLAKHRAGIVAEIDAVLAAS